jgi:hypothetical protein
MRTPDRPGILRDDRCEDRKRIFLKQEAKMPVPWRARRGHANAKESKVFWFFFSKKNIFSLASHTA